MKGRVNRTLAERLAEKVTFEPNSGCHLWTGAQNAYGYGSSHYKGRLLGMHRVAYETYVGEIPDGMHVCHTCDVRLCINPAHLFLGSPRDNVLDAKSKWRHVHGERHGCSKLSEADVREIRLRTNETTTALAKEFKVSRVTLRRARIGQNWKHI